MRAHAFTRLLTVLAAVALLATLLGGCAPEGELADHVTPGPPFHFNITALPADYQPWFAEAAEQWNTATGKTLIVIDPEGEHVAYLEDLPWSRFADARCKGPLCRVRFTTDTIWTQCGGTFTNPSTSFRGIAAHELGHVLGAFFPDHPEDPVHSPISQDMMFSDAGECEPLTNRDVAAIRW